jgi:NAD(P)-dependent dehydrogenase (short-subunit alcohol dehydrogenase family)
MDLGIAGRCALVCASSKCLGRAFAFSLAREGADVTRVARGVPDVLGLSNGARSGLTGFVAGLARKTVANNVTINKLLPGPFDIPAEFGEACVYLCSAQAGFITGHNLLLDGGNYPGIF